MIQRAIKHLCARIDCSQQANDSVAGLAAMIRASELACIELISNFEMQLIALGYTFVEIIVYLNTSDVPDMCGREGDGRAGDGTLGTKCCTACSPTMELNLQLGLRLMDRDGLRVEGIVGWSNTPGAVAARLAACSPMPMSVPAVRPNHFKEWRGKWDDIVAFISGGSKAMAPVLLHLLGRIGVSGLPSEQALADKIYDKACELKARDAPRLGALPSAAEAPTAKASAQQASRAASDSKLRYWNEQRRLKKAGLPNVLNDEIAVLLLEEVDPPHWQDTVTLTKMSEDQMKGFFNPDNNHATRRQVYMPMRHGHRALLQGERQDPQEARGAWAGRPPKDAEALKVLKVTIL